MLPQAYLSGISPKVMNVWMNNVTNHQQLVPKLNHTQGWMMEFGPTAFADRLFIILPLVIFALPFVLFWMTHALHHHCSFHDPFFGFDRKTCWTSMSY